MSDGIVAPHPPVTRALREVAAACKKAGMQVVDWVSSTTRRGRLPVLHYWKDVLSVLAEAEESALPLTEFIINEQPNAKGRRLCELWEISLQRSKYRTDYVRHWVNTANDDGREVDMILGPAYPGAAPPHDCARCWPYTSTWNIIDYPAAIFPLAMVSSDDEKDLSYVPMNALDKHNYDRYEKEI
ncbi:amidase signature domain-containing protein [Aspergillus spectabilis]